MLVDLVLALPLFAGPTPAAPAPPAAPTTQGEPTAFERVVQAAERALERGDLDRAHREIIRALERDAKSRAVWELRATWAEAAENRDELVYSLHKQLGLAIAQKASRKETQALRKRLVEVDPMAADMIDMRSRFVKKLVPIAESYEKEGRYHSAIRVHKQILALDGERTESDESIKRMAAAPDPSLAEFAQSKDLLEGISDEWIRKHDSKHDEWGKRSKLKRENYTTNTDAGYAVMVRSAEAMEQMNAFYRKFFHYGTEEHGGSVSPIELNIYKSHEEYLKLTGAPEWSGGNFTGSAVNVPIGDAGFEASVGTLFHEAAHQFVSLATNASGWLNEGLASFFEGTRILPNGSVEMNLPANNRLMPLADRLRRGWMSDVEDGIDPKDPSATPSTAPTLSIIIENRYQWGPPWYAPTWGLVYFFYNFQDPIDGRYIYREGFWDFVDKSGGRTGKSAVGNFAEIVLQNPEPPTKGVDVQYDEDTLPMTVPEIDELWKSWLLELAAEQQGRIDVEKPWLDWARYAVERGAIEHAVEHFEKGLRAAPNDVDLLKEFAELLAEEYEAEDRAIRLALRAVQLLERAEPPDQSRIDELEKLLKRWDPERRDLEKIQLELDETAQYIVRRYLSAGMDLMTMDLSLRLGSELDVPGMFELYEQAFRRSNQSILLWQLAYNEEDLRNWAGPNKNFMANGEYLDSDFTSSTGGEFDYNFLTLDTVTSGDFSLEAQILVEPGKSTFAGLVFGRKTDTTFHSAVLFPPKAGGGVTTGSGFIDLASFYGGSNKTWRHAPTFDPNQKDQSKATGFDRLRVDVTGSVADIWFNGRFIATQDFGTADVLRGTFGLITGPGQVRWRNVRFLARPARDPGAAISREIKLEDVIDDSGSIGGSWQGKRPPFPSVHSWVQGERTSWDEEESVPQLLVLFSQTQNDLIPLESWLANLQQETREYGLEFVCIASPMDQATIEEYLRSHPFPGAVGVDRFPDEGGIGVTFEDYAIMSFNLPRLILLDVDGTVAWEGDPGFKVGMGWNPAAGSFLDTPLADLIEKRKLDRVGPWATGWNAVAKPALASGDLAAALPYLVEAKDFDPKAFATVREAQIKFQAIEAAAAAPEAVARSFERDGTEPAMDSLAQLASELDPELELGKVRAVKMLKKNAPVKDWKQALELLKPVAKDLKKDKPVDRDELLAELEELEGLFPKLLAAEIREASDDEALAEVVQTAKLIPERWLLQDYLGW